MVFVTINWASGYLNMRTILFVTLFIGHAMVSMARIMSDRGSILFELARDLKFICSRTLTGKLTSASVRE